MKKKFFAGIGVLVSIGLLFCASFILKKGGEVILIQANPEKGFYYEYYLYIPEDAGSEGFTNLLVCPNNTGTVSDDHDVHVKRVRESVNASINSYPKNIAYDLKVPMLIPVFDRPKKDWKAYTHALDSDTMNIETGKLERIDLQLLAMIEDAKLRLEEEQLEVADKVIMDGFSASGNFTNRFVALHPENVEAATMGGVNSMPTIPLETLDSVRLPFHVGVYGVEKYIGHPFDMEVYKSVTQYIYMGADDENDTLPYDDAYNEDERIITVQVLGETMKERWANSQDLYHELEIPAQMVTYEKVGHTVTREMKDDIVQFYRNTLKKRTE